MHRPNLPALTAFNADINVTPMIDVLLVLMIVFMLAQIERTIPIPMISQYRGSKNIEHPSMNVCHPAIGECSDCRITG